MYCSDAFGGTPLLRECTAISIPHGLHIPFVNCASRHPYSREWPVAVVRVGSICNEAIRGGNINNTKLNEQSPELQSRNVCIHVGNFFLNRIAQNDIMTAVAHICSPTKCEALYFPRVLRRRKHSKPNVTTAFRRDMPKALCSQCFTNTTKLCVSRLLIIPLNDPCPSSCLENVFSQQIYPPAHARSRTSRLRRERVARRNAAGLEGRSMGTAGVKWFGNFNHLFWNCNKPLTHAYSTFLERDGGIPRGLSRARAVQ